MAIDLIYLHQTQFYINSLIKINIHIKYKPYCMEINSNKIENGNEKWDKESSLRLKLKSVQF